MAMERCGKMDGRRWSGAAATTVPLPAIRVITGTRWFRKKEEGNPDQIILQEFIALNYERLEVSNEIRQRAGEFYEILRQTDFPNVGSVLALAARVYIAALDLESSYTFKELRLKDIKDTKFSATKNKIVNLLKGNGISLGKNKITPLLLLKRYAAQFRIVKGELDRISAAAENAEKLGLSEHPDSIARALLVLGREKRIPPITMEQVSNATNLNIGTQLEGLEKYCMTCTEDRYFQRMEQELRLQGLRLRYRLEQGLRFGLEQGLERRKEQGRKSIEFLSWMQKEGRSRGGRALNFCLGCKRKRKEQGRKSIEFLFWMQREGAGEEEH